MKQQKPNRFSGVKLHNIINEQNCISSLVIMWLPQKAELGVEVGWLLIHSNFRYLCPNFLSLIDSACLFGTKDLWGYAAKAWEPPSEEDTKKAYLVWKSPKASCPSETEQRPSLWAGLKVGLLIDTKLFRCSISSQAILWSCVFLGIFLFHRNFHIDWDTVVQQILFESLWVKVMAPFCSSCQPFMPRFLMLTLSPHQARHPLPMALTSWLRTTWSFWLLRPPILEETLTSPCLSLLPPKPPGHPVDSTYKSYPASDTLTSLLDPTWWELSPFLTWITAVPFTWSLAFTLTPTILRTTSGGSLLAPHFSHGESSHAENGLQDAHALAPIPSLTFPLPSLHLLTLLQPP